MEVVFKDELFLPEITKDFYTMILFTSCTLTVESDETKSYSDYGLLVLAPDHGIRKISVTSKSKNYSVQTLIFSSFGLNVNNKKFPDSFEYEFFKNFDTGYRKVSITPKLLETFTTNFANIESEMNIVQGHLWPCIARSYISELVILLSRNIFLSQIHTQNEDASEKKNQGNNRVLSVFNERQNYAGSGFKNVRNKQNNTQFHVQQKIRTKCHCLPEQNENRKRINHAHKHGNANL